MLTLKEQYVQKTNFKEGNNADQLSYQFASPAARTMLTFKGTVVISAVTPSVAPIMSVTPGEQIYPYLLKLAGLITFVGKRKDTSKGFSMNTIPAWVLWLDYFIKTGIPLKVDDGGMAAAGFAAGSYAYEINVPILHYDPRYPQSQQPMQYFRPVNYGEKPYLMVKCGTLFEGQVTDTRDDVAVTGDATGDITYTVNGVIRMTTQLCPALRQSPNDVCVDVAHEYIPLLDATPSEYNKNELADTELQNLLTLISTEKVEIGTGEGLYEKGSNRLGLALDDQILTKLGTVPLMNPYAGNLQSDNQGVFMTAGYQLPAGVYIMDYAGANMSEWETKTMLQPSCPSHQVFGEGSPAPTGSNFYILHQSFNISQAGKLKVGVFPRFAGLVG